MRMPLSQPVAGWQICHVEMFAVQGHFPGCGYAAEVGPHVIGAGFKAERGGKSFEALAAGCVKASFLRFVVGAGGIPLMECSGHENARGIKRGPGSWIAGWLRLCRALWRGARRRCIQVRARRSPCRSRPVCVPSACRRRRSSARACRPVRARPRRPSAPPCNRRRSRRELASMAFFHRSRKRMCMSEGRVQRGGRR